MRTARNSLALALLAGPALAQDVADCDPAPPMTALVEPWEETTAVLAGGAVRLAVIEAAQGSVELIVLTLPPVAEPAEGEEGAAPAPPVPRRCRAVTEGGIGFATLDLAGLQTAEDPEAATFTATLPALRFVPESSDLEEVTLRLVFGVADDALAAAIVTSDP